MKGSLKCLSVSHRIASITLTWEITSERHALGEATQNSSFQREKKGIKKKSKPSVNSPSSAAEDSTATEYIHLIKPSHMLFTLRYMWHETTGARLIATCRPPCRFTSIPSQTSSRILDFTALWPPMRQYSSLGKRRNWQNSPYKKLLSNVVASKVQQRSSELPAGTSWCKHLKHISTNRSSISIFYQARTIENQQHSWCRPGWSFCFFAEIPALLLITYIPARTLWLSTKIIGSMIVAASWYNKTGTRRVKCLTY